MNIDEVKKQFPIFKNHPNLVYLDSAATSHKPESVVNKIVEFYHENNSNVHRGLYPLSNTATELYEEARNTIANFINADPEEIIFIPSATIGFNGLIDSLRRSGMINKETKILLSELEHHSNITPWQNLDTQIDYAKVDNNYSIDLDSVGSDYDIVSLVHASNVSGSVLDVKKARNKFKDSILILDSTQAVAHLPIDVKELDVDFMMFSGHKLYGPMGIGVMYGKKELLEKIEPMFTGGGMIREVTKQKSSWGELPEKFEAGTPNVAGALGLAESIKFISKIGFENIQSHEKELKNYALSNLSQIQNIQIFHDKKPNSIGVISFSIDNIHPHDIAEFLGQENICVRAGHHCTQILHRDSIEQPASVRLSLGIYNQKEDINKLIVGLQEIKNVF